MKQIISYLFCFAIISGCTRGGSFLIDSPTPTLYSMQFLCVRNNNFISSGDILNRFGEMTRQNIDMAIEPITAADGDTTFYIVNFGANKGWKLISSDARTPAVLGESGSGSFSIEEGSPALASWVEFLSNDMYIIRHSPDSLLSFSTEEIAANKAFWTNLDRGPILPGHGEGPGEDPGGHWYVHGVSVTEPYDSLRFDVPHWAQWNPYNKYCPLKYNSSTERVPAGCGAVAAAQIVYYYHNLLGVPQTMYSVGSCVGNEYNYQQNFSVPSSTVWETMLTYYNGYDRDCTEAILIGCIGLNAHTNYASSGSATSMYDIQSTLESFGLNCTYSSYSESTVRSNLIQLKPVMICASTSVLPVFDWGSTHGFVMDGYKRTRVKTTTYHDWIPDNPGDPGNNHSYSTVSYSSPIIAYAHINWGWKSQWLYGYNDGWYALTGEWYTVDGYGNYSGSYDFYRSMIHDFSTE